MTNPDSLTATARFVVRTGIILNYVFLLAVCIGLVLSFVWGRGFTDLLFHPLHGVDGAAQLVGARFELLLGIAMALATACLLSALAEMIESAREGDPFIAINAGRLRAIGWALLVLQLLEIPGALLGRFYPSLGSAAPQADFAPGGWIAVVMVFVLARIFAAGTAMRDELEGTI